MNRHHSAADNQRSSSLSESLGRTVPATRVTPRPSLEQLNLRGSKKHPIYILEDDEDAHEPTSSFKKRITSPSASLDVQNSSQELHRQSDSKVEQTDGTAVVPAANNSPLPPPVTSQGVGGRHTEPTTFPRGLKPMRQDPPLWAECAICFEEGICDWQRGCGCVGWCSEACCAMDASSTCVYCGQDFDGVCRRLRFVARRDGI